MQQSPPIVTTPSSWFSRGLLVGLLLTAVLNALSFFVRTRGWGSLLGGESPNGEAIGFPFELWQLGNDYGGYFVDYAAMAKNTLFGLVIGTIFGLVALNRVRWLNTIVDEIVATAPGQEMRRFQFSLRGLFLAATLVAILAAVGRTLAARPEVLAGIYLIGPTFLVGLGMLPRRIPWQQRVAIMVPAMMIVIVVAVAVGNSLNIEVDVVVRGIFVCWVPQTGLAALALTCSIFSIYAIRSKKLRVP